LKRYFLLSDKAEQRPLVETNTFYANVLGTTLRRCIEVPKLSFGTPQAAGMNPAQIDLIRQRLAEWMDGKVERGGVFLAARRGKIVLHEALGPLTDKAGSASMRKDSIFAVSSVSKPITAIGIMGLVEDGLLGLNRPIKEYFPEVCGEGTDAIEVQHLLTHTSGFREDECWRHLLENLGKLEKNPTKSEPGQHQNVADYLTCMADVKSHFAPGSLMHYNSHNYALLAELIRRVSGLAPMSFFKERVFDPLGMEGSSYMNDPARTARQVVRGEGAPAGSQDGDPFAIEGEWMRSAPWGFLGVNSTALDLAILGQTFLNGGTYGNTRLLSRPSVHEMTRDQLPGIQSEINDLRSAEASWGLGWAIQGNTRWTGFSSTLVPKGAFWHTGNGGSQIWVDPENEIVGVYLSVGLIKSETSEIHWHGDIFQNMVTAAVAD
jgi:CubicO group peptidase (beta-lactamase class C family)